MPAPILLKDIWPIKDILDYKVHFGRKSPDGHRPLDVWMHDRAEWKGWQQYRSQYRPLQWLDDFNRPYIFSLMQFHPEPDAWLFGGIFRVLERPEDSYEVKLMETGKSFIGHLKLGSSPRARIRSMKFENHYDTFEVLEILREPYSGQPFPGYRGGSG